MKMLCPLRGQLFLERFTVIHSKLLAKAGLFRHLWIL